MMESNEPWASRGVHIRNVLIYFLCLHFERLLDHQNKWEHVSRKQWINQIKSFSIFILHLVVKDPNIRRAIQSGYCKRLLEIFCALNKLNVSSFRSRTHRWSLWSLSLMFQCKCHLNKVLVPLHWMCYVWPVHTVIYIQYFCHDRWG